MISRYNKASKHMRYMDEHFVNKVQVILCTWTIAQNATCTLAHIVRFRITHDAVKDFLKYQSKSWEAFCNTLNEIMCLNLCKRFQEEL